MKTLTAILIFSSFNTFAGFDNFKQAYAELVYPDVYDMRLEYKEYSTETPHGDISNQVIQDVLASNYSIGLDSMKLENIRRWNQSSEQIIQSIMKKLTIPSFFCSRYQAGNPYRNVGRSECVAKTQKLLGALISEKGISRLSTLTLVGDYYGDWEAVYVIAEKFKTGETIVVEFDIVHEI